MDTSQPLLEQPPVILAGLIVLFIGALFGIGFAFRGAVHI